MVFYDSTRGAAYTVPSPMDTRGRYLFTPPKTQRYNGEGLAVPAGYASVVWTFPYLKLTDYQWWRLTLMGSLSVTSVKFVAGTVLKNDFGDNINVSSCVVEIPKHDYASNGYYYNVVVNISKIR